MAKIKKAVWSCLFTAMVFFGLSCGLAGEETVGAPISNFILNSSFESLGKDGLPDNWEISQNKEAISIADNLAYQGKNSLHFKLDGKLTRFTQSESFPVVPGKTYTLSAMVKAENLAIKSVYGIMLVNDGWTWRSEALKIDPSKSGWQRYSVTFTVPPLEEQSKKFRVNMYWDGDKGEVWVDTVQLEEGRALTRWKDGEASLLQELVAEANMSAAQAGRRGVSVSRASRPPVLDGRLDDPCWQSAKPITDFIQNGSSAPAVYKTSGYIVYDDTNLYIGLRCFDPKPENIIAEKVAHDGNIWSHDLVEVMLDASGDGSKYVHLAVDAAGSAYDALCSKGVQDPRWDGNWQAKTEKDDQGWSVEMAVPLYNLQIIQKNPVIAVNLCREKPNPKELSSVSLEGNFHAPDRFLVLRGLDINFRGSAYRITSELVSFELVDGKPYARMEASVKNETENSSKIKIEPVSAGSVGSTGIPAKVVTLKPGESSKLDIKSVELQEMTAGKPGKYMVIGQPAVEKVIISDPATSSILSGSSITAPRTCTVLEIKVDNPVSSEKVSIKPDKIIADVEILLTEKDSTASTLAVELINQENKVVDSQEIQHPQRRNRVSFAAGRLPWGLYLIQAAYRKGETGLLCREPYPLMPDGKEQIKVLNNLVFELLNTATYGKPGNGEFAFMNPRKGWVFISAETEENVEFFLDDKAGPVLKGEGIGKPVEAMRLLDAGRHRILTKATGQAVGQVVVRAIPELIYARLAFIPHMKEFGPYDWEFLSEDVLPNCTTILGPTRGEYTKTWLSQGKRWVNETAGTGVNISTGDKATTDDFIAAWKKSGLSDPSVSGLFMDEFGGADFPVITPVIEAMRHVSEKPEYAGCSIIPWCYFIPGRSKGFNHGSEAANLLAEVTFRSGSQVAYEAYALEAPNDESAKRVIDLALIEPVQDWNRVFPQAVQRMVLTLEYSSPEFMIDPGTDFKVFMDMQFQALANDPAFFGLYGVMEYISSWSDRETVAWAGRLYRHYCIEGKKKLLSRTPYVLKHIQNPNFDDNVNRWEVRPAEPGSITAKIIPGYGRLQGWSVELFAGGWQNPFFGSEWLTKGDHVLWMRRCAEKPNVFSQEIRNLHPGGLYSFKMITGDYGQLRLGKSANTLHPLSVEIEGADLLTETYNNFTTTFQNTRQASEFPAFNGDNPYWFNYHWQVFRARGTTAKLVISDWTSPTEPGGPIGQELTYNFIEVQPYLLENK